MERVQFQEEQMLPELKSFLDEAVFTQKEIKAILIQRRHYESALIRRISRKSDYLRYIDYEMSLEKLRKARVQRLQLARGKDSQTEFVLVRRQFALFERALKRPKLAADVSMWIQYIQLAQKEGARTLVGRIVARALSRHPNNASVYIIASSHALDEQQSPTAARTLLQRGLRLNKDNLELWKAYVSMEIGFVVTTGRRWGILGISEDNQKGKEKQSADVVMDDGEELSSEARREILDGAIVRSVIAAAAEARPLPSLLCELITLVQNYPAPQQLRESLVDYLYTLLPSLPTCNLSPSETALALKLLATRPFGLAAFVSPSLGPNSLLEVSALHNLTPRVLLDSVSQSVRIFHDRLRIKIPKSRRTDTAEESARVYAEFVKLFCRDPEFDTSLKDYLSASLRVFIQDALTRMNEKEEGWCKFGVGLLMAAHLEVLELLGNGDEAVVAKASRKYCKSAGVLAPEGRAAVWLARLDVEKKQAALSEATTEKKRRGIDDVWREAREVVGVAGEDDERISRVWLWGVSDSEDSDRARVLEDLIIESKLFSARITQKNVVHPRLLEAYLRTALCTKGLVDVQWVQRWLRRSEWSVDAETWKKLFSIAASTKEGVRVDAVKELYYGWLDSTSSSRETVETIIAFVEYLVAAGETLDAARVVQDGLGRLATEPAREAVEAAWARLRGP
ncbi:U3 small nucleolar RNA-associated protein 6-domain-containing protein [Flagelloscypha sp. PMI_526]|nr:U3 small nucleolar RNA-associated protein 6-domain-containing protein [Flagelloscypha sp. PMI_526]